MLELLGWLNWMVAVVLAISWTIGCWRTARSPEGVSWAPVIQALSFYIVSVLFLVFGWNKMHILWLLPLIVFVAPFITTLGGMLGGSSRHDLDEPPPDLLDETGTMKNRDQLTSEQQRRADEFWERQTEKLRSTKDWD